MGPRRQNQQYRTVHFQYTQTKEDLVMEELRSKGQDSTEQIDGGECLPRQMDINLLALPYGGIDRPQRVHDNDHHCRPRTNSKSPTHKISQVEEC